MTSPLLEAHRSDLLPLHFPNPLLLQNSSRRKSSRSNRRETKMTKKGTDFQEMKKTVQKLERDQSFFLTRAFGDVRQPMKLIPSRVEKGENINHCLSPGSNRGPLVCETNVITNYTTQTSVIYFINILILYILYLIPLHLKYFY